MKSVGLNKGFGAVSSEHQQEGSNKKNNTSKRDRLSKTWIFIVREAKAVSIWSLLSMVLRVLLILLGMMSTSTGTNKDKDSSSIRWLNDDSSLLGIWKEVATTTGVLAGWILQLAPSKARLLQAPGFIFANPWLLLWVRDKTGVVPNLPIRACEYAMGRISLLELGTLLPIHVVMVVSTSVFLNRILPATLIQMALEPIEYSDGDNPWVVDFSREVVASSAFTVALLVLPALLQLNYIPRWIFAFAMYPLLNFSVDGRGTASVFSPNVLLALSILGYRPLPSFWRLLGPLFGGLVGGRVMKLYFPDRERVGAAS